MKLRIRNWNLLILLLLQKTSAEVSTTPQNHPNLNSTENSNHPSQELVNTLVNGIALEEDIIPGYLVFDEIIDSIELAVFPEILDYTIAENNHCFRHVSTDLAHDQLVRINQLLGNFFNLQEDEDMFYEFQRSLLNNIIQLDTIDKEMPWAFIEHTKIKGSTDVTKLIASNLSRRNNG